MTRGMCAVLLATTLVVTALAAPASADDPYDVPGDATITIEGDGSGHGRGLSQYGAKRAAEVEGLKVREILDFYYPDTSIGRIAGSVRVWISRDDDRNLRVDDEVGLTIRAGSRKWTPSIRRATQWRVKAKGARNVISYRTGSWHTFRTVRADVTFSARRTPLTLRTPDERLRYRGRLTTTRHDGERITVNTLRLEQYLRGVVPAEMPASWAQHALRAQAVASRTYAAFERSHFRRRAYHLCDTAACQNYRGVTAESSRSTKAVKATARDVLVYRQDLAFAQYSASNGGYTVSGNRPYLPAQADPYEGQSPDYYGWEVSVTAAELEKFYDLENLTEIQVSGRNGQGPRGGRVTELLLTTEGGDSPGTYPVAVDRFVSSFGLKSSLFEITDVS